MARQSGETDEILLDVELDGARYLLVRLPKSEERAQLSPREEEIVRMVAGGHPNKTIASVLNISCWTVCTSLRRIFVKLGVNFRAAMVARMESGWMQKRGLLELSSQSNASETMSPDVSSMTGISKAAHFSMSPMSHDIGPCLGTCQRISSAKAAKATSTVTYRPMESGCALIQ